MIAAFFDVDNTVIKGNSGIYLGKTFLKNGKIKPSFFISKFIYFTLLYKIHKLDYSMLVKEAAKVVSGMRIEEASKLGKQCFNKEVKKRIYGSAVFLIQQHKKKGHIVVLATSAPKLVVDYLKEFLKIKHAILQEGVVKNGIITGEIKEPLCYGEGKKILVENFAKEHNIDLTKSFFYTDSYSDLPTLLIVGNKIVVNPDKKLKKVALKNKWKIKYFKRYKKWE